MRLVHVRVDQNHMATTFEFCISCEASASARAMQVLEEAHRWVSRLELDLSEFIPSSPVARLNRASADEKVGFPASALELLERSAKLRRATAGYFNPLAKSAPGTPADGIVWDLAGACAWRTDERAHLGFGAIGKGFALDQVREMLERAGFGDYLLSAGGSSIVLSGFAGPGDPWIWGWSWSGTSLEGRQGLAFSHASGRTIAIGVSGIDAQGAHLIRRDPFGGTAIATSAPERAIPSSYSLNSSLIAHPSAADADALSTALFVSGWEPARKFLSDLPAEIAVAAIDATGTPAWNGIFSAYWGSPAQSAMVAFGALVALSLVPSSPRADDTTANLPPSAKAADPAPVANVAAADSIDLGTLGATEFNPYIHGRNDAWALLPVLTAVLVLAHLRRRRRPKLNTVLRIMEKSS